MSDSKNAIDALIGGEATSASEPDYRALYEESQRELQKERVEGGRLKKTNEELDALRRENEELRAKRRDEALVRSLSEEERGDTPDAWLNASAKMVGKGMDEVDARIRELKQMQENEARAASDRARVSLVNRIDAEFPGWRSSVGPGGDKREAWNAYMRHNSASVKDALETCDFDTIKYHVENFYSNTLGIPVPSGNQSGSAAPDPVMNGGGNGGQDTAITGKTYTPEQFYALYDEVEAARDKGDFAMVKALEAEIAKAPAEGRVK